MTKVTINPGVCSLITKVTATTDEDMIEVNVQVDSMCEAVQKMFKELGNDFDAFEICLSKPGTNPFYQYAAENFPAHAACPTIAGIIKCIEAECKLALPRDVSVTFEK